VKQVYRLSTFTREEERPYPVDIMPMLASAAADAGRSFPGRDVRLRLPDRKEPLTVMGTELMVEVFSNILGNAVKHGRRDGTALDVSVDAPEDGPTVRVVFDDNGTGVPDDMKDRIFRRATGLEPSVHGRGLGLTLCDQIVRHAGGRIWVEDRVRGHIEQGSRFVVELKRA